MSRRKCILCGTDPAEGYASVWSADTGESFYCHGDDDGASCYERKSLAGAGLHDLADVAAEFGVDL